MSDWDDRDFDKEWSAATRFHRRFMITLLVIIIACVGFAFWAGYHVVMHFWG